MKKRMLAGILAAIVILGNINMEGLVLNVNASEELENELEEENTEEENTEEETSQISEEEDTEEVSESISVEAEDEEPSEELLTQMDESEYEPFLDDTSTASSKTTSGTGSIAIDEAHFPDPKFREEVKNAWGNFDGDEELTKQEINAITELSVSGKDIHNMEGIEYLTSLQYFDCNNNSLFVPMDLSKNTELKKLNCSGCKLTTLDVSKNVLLEIMDCSNNDLTSLNVNHNSELASLNCSNNHLSELKYLQCYNLQEFYCYDNNLGYVNYSDYEFPSGKFDASGNTFYADSTILDLQQVFPEADSKLFIFNSADVIQTGSTVILQKSGATVSYTYDEIEFHMVCGNRKVPVEKVVLQGDPDRIDIYTDGEPYPLNAVVYPQNAEERSVSFEIMQASDYCKIRNGVLIADNNDSSVQTAKLKITCQDISKEYIIVVYPNSTDANTDYEVTVYNKSAKKLSDVELPSALMDYCWESPNTDISATCNQDAVYHIVKKEDKREKGKYYAPSQVTVHFTSLTADALKELGIEPSEGPFMLGYLGVNQLAYIDFGDACYTNGIPKNVTMQYEVKEVSSLDCNISPSSMRCITFSAAKVGTLKLKATVKIMQDTKVIQTASTVVSCEVRDDSKYIDYIGGEDLELTINSFLPEFLEVNQTVYVAAAAMGLKNSKGEELKGVSVTSSDKKVIEVAKCNKTTEDGKQYYKLTAKKAGLCRITITAKNNSKVKKEFLLPVKDYCPVFETTQVTIDKVRVEQFGMGYTLVPGTEYVDVDIDIEKMPEALKKSGLDVEGYTSGLSIQFKDSTREDLKDIKGSYKVTLKFILNKTGEGEIKLEKEITIKVVENIPQIHIKQIQPLNSFYIKTNEKGELKKYDGNSSYAEYQLVCENIAPCYVTPEIASKSADYFNLAYWNGYSQATGVMRICINHNYHEKPSQLPKKIYLDFTLGVREGYNLSDSVSFKMVKKAPNLKAVLVKSNLYPKMDDNTAVVEIFKDGEKEYMEREEYDIRVSEGFSLDTDEYELLLTNLTGKTKSATITIENDYWADNLTVKVTPKVNTKTPMVKLLTPKMNLNSSAAFITYDVAQSAIDVTNEEDYTIKRANIAPADDKTRKNGSQLSVTYDYDNVAGKGRIEAQFSYSVKKGYKKPINGTYSYTVTPILTLTTDEGIHSCSAAPVKLTITVSDKKTNVKMKAEGSLDLLHRDTDEILYQPIISGINGDVAGMELIGRDCSYFGKFYDADQNVLRVKLYRDKDMTTTVKYEVQVRVTLVTENGSCVLTSSKIYIQPKQENLKASTWKESNGVIWGKKVYNINMKAMEVENVYSDINNMGNSGEYEVPVYFDKKINTDYDYGIIRAEVASDAPIIVSQDGASQIHFYIKKKYIKAGASYSVPVDLYLGGSDCVKDKPVKLTLKITISSN